MPRGFQVEALSPLLLSSSSASRPRVVPVTPSPLLVRPIFGKEEESESLHTTTQPRSVAACPLVDIDNLSHKH